jgi:hypothetical protein
MCCGVGTNKGQEGNNDRLKKNYGKERGKRKEASSFSVSYCLVVFVLKCR